MSDIDVTIQVTPELELGNLKSDLEAALSGVESGLKKLKIQIDASEATREIQRIKSDLSSLTDKKIAIDIGGLSRSRGSSGRTSDAPKKLIEDYNAYNDAIKKVNDTLTRAYANKKKWTAAENGTSSGAYQEYGRYIKNLEGLKDVMPDMLKSEFDAVFKGINSGLSEAINKMEVAGERIKIPDELIKGTKEYSAAIIKADKEISGIEDKLASWSKLTGLDSASQSKITDVRNALGEIKSLKNDVIAGDKGITTASFDTQLTGIKAKVTATISELNRMAKASSTTQPFTEGMAGYQKALIDVNTQIENMEAKSKELRELNTSQLGGNTSLEKEIASFDQYITKFEDLKTKLTSGKLTKTEFNEVFKKLGEEARKAGADVNDLYKSLYGGQMVNQGGAGLKELKDAEDLLAEMTVNLRKWDMAKSGKSSDAYKTYQDQANALRDLVSNAKDGKVSVDDLNKSFNDIKTTGDGAAATIKANGENISSFSSHLGGMIQRFSFYFSMTRVVMMTIQKLKEMVKASMEIETAMARIQIVTGATDTQMTSFFESASNQAKELGKNITDVAKSIETFSRLGYSLTDATQLSKYATIMSNVGDTTVENATTGITSIIKGYGLNPSDAEHVSDVLINIGQKYAISAEELMEAFQRGGAALAASGTSFEESAALFAATNASLQNAATTGTLWKTVSARIRSAKTELEELGEDTTDLADGFSKYREELKALTGVDIMEDEDHYKSMLTIFNELAAVWYDLRSDEARARVGEILGGTRNLSGIMSTIQNIKDAQNAYTDAMNSAGVAMEANNIYMETTEAHVGQLKSSFQELSVDVFNSDFMKGFVDGARGAIEAIDSLVEHIGVLGTTITGVLGGIAISKGVTAFKNTFLGSTGIFATMSAQITTFISSLSGLALGAIAGIGSIIVALGILTHKYQKERSYDYKADKAKNSAAEYANSKLELEEIDSKIKSVEASIEEINSLDGAKINRDGELAKLESTLTSLKIQKSLLEQINNLKAEQSANDARDFLGSESTYKTGNVKTVRLGRGDEQTIEETRTETPLEKALYLQNEINDVANERDNLLKKINKSTENGNKLDEKTINSYKARAKVLEDRLEFLSGEQAKTLEDINNSYSQLFDSEGNVRKGYQTTVDAVEDFYEKIEYINKNHGNVETELPTIDTSSKKFSEYIENAKRANEKIKEDYKKSQKELSDLGVDPSKTVFGNIDTNDRQVIKWTENNLNKYKDAITSWVGDKATWEDTVNDMKDTISTVMGSTMNFGTDDNPLPIAFSPMLQTTNGAVLLSKDTVSEYISSIIDKARGEDGSWTTEGLMEEDKKGLEVNGVYVQGIIADVGDMAETTSKSMHYLGKDGELALKKLKIEGKEALSTLTEDRFLDMYGRGGALGEAVNELVNEALNLGIISDTSRGSLQSLANALAENGVIMASTVGNMKDTETAVETLSKYQETYTSALSSSTSATGLNAEEIQNLTNAYKHLEGFNPARLFETTANGIHLNEEYMKQLNAQIENEGLRDLYKQLEEAVNKKEELSSKHQDTKAVDDEILSIQQLIAQYEGLTSAYNKWQTAKSATKERDMYQNVGSAYEQMKETLDQGWYGDEELNAYLDMMLSASQRTGDAYEDFQKLDRKIEGTSHSLMDYWQYDDDKNLVTEGMFDFLDDVNKVFGDTYAKVDENGEYTWDLTNGKLEEVAEHFGTTTEMIQMFERALIDAGATVILDSQEINDLQGNLQKLQQAGQISSDIDLGFEASEMSLEDIQSKIRELENEKVRIEAEADTDGADTALNQLEATIEALKSQEIAVKIQTELASGKSIDDLLGDEDLATTLDIDTSQVEEARAMLEQLKSGVDVPVTVKMDEGQFEQLVSGERQETVTVTYIKDTSDPDGYQPEPKDGKVTFKKDSSDPDNYQPPPKDGLVTFHKNTSEIDNYQPLDKHATVTYHVVVDGTIPAGGGTYAGTMSSVSVARANGTAYNAPWNFRNAYANGQVALSKDEIALVNELGTESIIRNGQWMLIPGGMHQEALKKGDIILSAAQTKALIETGRADGHGRAFALGTLLSNAYDSGTGGRRRKNSSSSSSSSGSKSSSGRSSGSSKGSSSSGSSDGAKQAEEAKEAAENLMDWIEVAISRIQRSVTNFTTKSSRTFSILTDRLTAADGAISKVNKEMEIQRKGAERYLKQANSVGLSADLAKKVQDGTIDINNYDEATKKLIDDYKQWYEKALECKDAVLELNDTLGELYSNKFNTVQTAYDNRIELLNHMITTYDNAMDDLEARGYLALAEYYKRQKSVQQEILKRQQTELNRLITQMSNAVNSGAVKVNSEAWYDMQDAINACKEAIQETNTAIIELGNSYRNVLWERFEYTQELISNITDETEFLIKLMSNTDLYDEMGQLTETGLSTMGMHGQNYNTYMYQADKYAEEIRKINKELAKDPYNTILINKREEYLKAQRESILNAEDEKQAIVDLVEDGINKELDSLKELIDTYNESLDSAKNLYDYQKKIKEQTGDIAKLRKQLAAYQNDTSEENRARVQKLNVDLNDALEKLEESEYEHQISEQKKLLDDMYNEYEEILNKRLDNIDLLISDMIEKVNDNSKLISQTISEEASDVGYTITEALTEVWSADGGMISIITMYGDKFVSIGTSLNTVLNGIEAYIARSANESSALSKDVIKNNTQETKAVKKSTSSNASKSKTTSKTSNTGKSGVVTPNMPSNSQLLNMYQSASAGSKVIRKLANGNLVATDYKEQDGFLHVHVINAKEDFWGWVQKSMVKAHAKGARRISRDETAWIDEYGNELVLRPTENAMLTKLKAGDAVLNASATDNIFDFGNNPKEFLSNLGFDSASDALKYGHEVSRNVDIGGISINIPIDHVDDYNDFVNQMRNDSKFEKFIQSMTVDRLVGGSKLSKNKYKW